MKLLRSGSHFRLSNPSKSFGLLFSITFRSLQFYRLGPALLHSLFHPLALVSTQQQGRWIHNKSDHIMTSLKSLNTPHLMKMRAPSGHPSPRLSRMAPPSAACYFLDTISLFPLFLEFSLSSHSLLCPSALGCNLQVLCRKSLPPDATRLIPYPSYLSEVCLDLKLQTEGQ